MEEKKGMPLIGDKFPEMTVSTTHGEIKLPDKFEGQWFILFSHPAISRRCARRNSTPSRKDTISSESSTQNS